MHAVKTIELGPFFHQLGRGPDSQQYVGQWRRSDSDRPRISKWTGNCIYRPDSGQSGSLVKYMTCHGDEESTVRGGGGGGIENVLGKLFGKWKSQLSFLFERCSGNGRLNRSIGF